MLQYFASIHLPSSSLFGFSPIKCKFLEGTRGVLLQLQKLNTYAQDANNTCILNYTGNK